MLQKAKFASESGFPAHAPPSSGGLEAFGARLQQNQQLQVRIGSSSYCRLCKWDSKWASLNRRRQITQRIRTKGTVAAVALGRNGLAITYSNSQNLGHMACNCCPIQLCNQELPKLLCAVKKIIVSKSQLFLFALLFLEPS